MTTSLAPFPVAHFFKDDGTPASGYKVFVYLAGTTTKTNSYTDSTGATPNTNPIVLNARGEANIWLSPGLSYKIVFTIPTDSDPPVVPIWTVDNIVTSSGLFAFSSTGLTTGSANAQVVANTNPSSFALTAGTQLYVTWGFTNTGALTLNVAGTGAISVKKALSGALVNLTGQEAVANTVGLVVYDGTVYELLTPSPVAPSALGAEIAGGRLTLTTGVPVTVTDVTAATTVFFTPYRGAQIALFDGVSAWAVTTFAEVALAVPATTAQMYDVFGFSNAGALNLEALAWTNDTTRATALVLQNGIAVKSGATTRRYLGSFRTTGVSGQTEDSLTKRYVWNVNNRALRPLKGIDATDSWTYTTATFRKFNGAATADVGVVCGLDEAELCAFVAGMVNNSAGVQAGVGLGIDSATVNSAQVFSTGRSNVTPSTHATPTAQYNGFPGLGFHTLSPLEISVASGTSTWNGDGSLAFEQTGLTGYMRG